MKHWRCRVRLLAVALLLSGCKEKYDQEFNESFWASQMAQAFNTAQAVSQRDFWLTNRLEIASLMPVKYLASYEQKFLKYGKSAGFTNSLLEKYLLLPRGITNSAPDYSELMLASAMPLRRNNGRIERVIISKYKGNFAGGWINEDAFQTALRNAAVQLSQLSADKPLPSVRQLHDPDGTIAATRKMISEEGAKEVERFAREHPLPLSQQPYFPYACLTALIIVIVGVLWWFYRSGSKSHP